MDEEFRVQFHKTTKPTFHGELKFTKLSSNSLSWIARHSHAVLLVSNYEGIEKAVIHAIQF